MATCHGEQPRSCLSATSEGRTTGYVADAIWRVPTPNDLLRLAEHLLARARTGDAGGVSVSPPDDALRTTLSRFGANGARAEQMLDSAAEHLRSGRPVDAQHAAYALREALMAILKLGGGGEGDVRKAAKEVVKGWRAGVEDEVLAERLARLELALGERRDDEQGPTDQRGRNHDLLAQVVVAFSRTKPTRTTGDLLDRFVGALSSANGWLHADDPPEPEPVAAVFAEACETLQGLFGPLAQRLEAMDELVAIASPTPADVAQLKARLGDGHPIIYLFDRAQGPGWMQALGDDPLLQPPAEDPWVAGPYLMRVGGNDPDAVLGWLRTRPADLKAKQVADLLRIARWVQHGDVLAVALQLSRKTLADPDVVFQLDVLLQQLPADQQHGAAARSALQLLLTRTLAAERRSLDLYMAGHELAVAIAATAQGDAPAAWLTMLAHRAREVAGDVHPTRVRLLPPLSELSLESARSPLELVAAGLRQAANAAAGAGLDLDTRLELVRLVGEPLAGRLTARHLLDQLPAGQAAAVASIGERIATDSWPSPEALALLRRLRDLGSTGLLAAIAAALGPAPDPAQISVAVQSGALDDGLQRAHRWLVAIDASMVPEWHAADAEITRHAGQASHDGVMIRSGVARWGPATSPIASDDLAALAPLEAAARVAAWRPKPDASFMDPDASGLATTLREAIERRSDAWLAADPVALASALHEPRYVAALVDALQAHAEHLPDADRIVALADAILAEADASGDEGDALLADTYTWSQLRPSVVKLLGRLGHLGRLGADADARAWEIIVSAVGARRDQRPIETDDDREPLMAAIARPSMQALEAALQFGGGGTDGPDPRLLDLLAEMLKLPGTDGLHARAVLAIQWPWLRHTAPAWFAAHAEEIFGDAAPDGLGDATMDVYLEYGAVSEELLAEHRDAVVKAFGGDQREQAVQHLLHGMMLGVDGYEPAALAPVLAAAGPAAIADAAVWLGTAFGDAPDADLSPVTAMWRALLRLELPSENYTGFGWLAANERLDQSPWLQLTAATVTAAAGNLAEPDRVAERAARSAGDERAGRIIAGLLAADPQPWELQRIGANGLELLPTLAGPTAEEVRERLLQRGFYDAR